MRHSYQIRFTTVTLLLCALLVSLNAYCETYVDVNTPGTLSALLTDAQKDTCRSLVVSGKQNSADIRTLRQMGGYGDEGGKTGRLENLNLKDARFVNDKEPFMVLDAAKENLVGTAAYGRIKNRNEVVGVPLQKLHETDYGKYERSIHWREPSYFWDPSVMNIRGAVVQYFTPNYFLGHRNSENITFAYPATITSDTRDIAPYTASRNAEGPFLFAEGLSDEDWRLMKRYKITRFSGHRVYKDEDGHYKMSVRSNRRHFFHDTFYKCTTLKTVVLPRDCSVDYTIKDLTSAVCYQYPSPVVNLYYFKKRQKQSAKLIPGLVIFTSTGERVTSPYLPLNFLENRSQAKLDETAKGRILDVLSGLAVADGVTAERLDFSGARIMAIQGDVNNVINYHIDKNCDYVYCDKDRCVYRMSEELCDILCAQGVMKKHKRS